MANLIYRDLTKFQFLRRNQTEIGHYLNLVAGILRAKYGTLARPVSTEDVWVITNCEAGITPAGKVDPDFVHSLGEVGFYPLPNNIKDWNGPDAPVWNESMPIEKNVYHYMLYIGHLKNKVVKTLEGRELYRDLFRGRQGDMAPETNAKVLAGVVHGYFFAGNYCDEKVPLQHLLAGYDNNTSLAEMMRTTKFVHAGTPIISNRERNIKHALDELD